jgi:hypothetical protein
LRNFEHPNKTNLCKQDITSSDAQYRPQSQISSCKWAHSHSSYRHTATVEHRKRVVSQYNNWQYGNTDFALINSRPFRTLKNHLGGKRFATDADVNQAVACWLQHLTPIPFTLGYEPQRHVGTDA